MNEQLDKETLWHLQGNWAPVQDEIDAVDLPVEGIIPEAIKGSYFPFAFCDLML